MAEGSVVVNDPEAVDFVNSLAGLWGIPKTAAAAKALKIARSRINATTKYAQKMAKVERAEKKASKPKKAPAKKAAPKAKAPKVRKSKPAAEAKPEQQAQPETVQ